MHPDNLQVQSMAQIAFASFIGTTIEYYDFHIYGLATALVLPALFFPRLNPCLGVACVVCLMLLPETDISEQKAAIASKQDASPATTQ